MRVHPSPENSLKKFSKFGFRIEGERGKLMPRRKEPVQIKDDQVIVSAKACAMAFGVTARTVNDWVRKGCPKLEKDTYNLRDVINWRYSAENKPESLEAQKLKADVRYRESRADMEEMKRKVMVGEYVAVDEIKTELTDAFGQVQQTMRNIKAKVLQQLYTTYPDCAFDVANVVENEVERGLKTLASGKKAIGRKRS